MKKITVNLDDLGLSPAVNLAACRLAEMQRIHSASLMSLGRIGSDEVAHLRRHRIDLGLHLDCTALSQEGSLKQIILRSWLHRWQPEKLHALIARQLDAFENQTGQIPVFVDGHQHVHQFPQIREALQTELKRRYGFQVALRSTRPLAGDGKSHLIYALGGRRFDRQIRPFPHNSRFGGVYAFQDNDAALRRRWQTWLAAAPANGTLLMCHPALPDGNWQDEIKTAREREWHWLSGREFGELWQRENCCGQQWQEFSAASNQSQSA